MAAGQCVLFVGIVGTSRGEELEAFVQGHAFTRYYSVISVRVTDYLDGNSAPEVVYYIYFPCSALSFACSPGRVVISQRDSPSCRETGI